MSFLYNIFGLALRWIYDITANYGFSIVLFAFFAKVITIPLSYMQHKSTQMLKAVTPLQNQIQKKFAHDKTRANEEIQKLYKTLNYKPLTSCLPMLIQMPIIIGLFGVLRNPELYSFSAEEYSLVNKAFLWIADMTVSPLDLYKTAIDAAFFKSLIIPIVSVGLTFYSQKQSQTGASQESNKMMMIVMNGLIAYMSFTFNQGLAIYWTVNTALSIVQTLLMNKFVHIKIPEITIKTRKKNSKGGAQR